MAGKKGISGRKPLWTAEEVKQAALKAIENDDKIVFLTDVFKIAGYTQDTFYKYLPRDSEGWKEVTEALNKNKGDMKKEIRNRLLASNNVTGLIALYKLLGNEDERNALCNHKIKDESKPDENKEIEIEIQ